MDRRRADIIVDAGCGTLAEVIARRLARIVSVPSILRRYLIVICTRHLSILRLSSLGHGEPAVSSQRS